MKIDKLDLKEIAEALFKNTEVKKLRFRGFISYDIMNKSLEDTAQRMLFKFYDRK